MGCSTCGSCGSERVDGVEHGGAWRWRHVRAAQEHGGARGQRRRVRAALGEREDARRRLGMVVGDHGGEQRRERGRGGGERRCVAAAAARDGSDAGETERKRNWRRAREIYDRWDPQFSLTPVDPTPRV